jgi:hypothetical protein
MRCVTTELLFSYGTLCQLEVQLAAFGRDRHPILKPSDRTAAAVEGMVFPISVQELAAADEYEVDDYRRIAVPLRSGKQAWVYVFSR